MFGIQNEFEVGSLKLIMMKYKSGSKFFCQTPLGMSECKSISLPLREKQKMKIQLKKIPQMLIVPHIAISLEI